MSTDQSTAPRPAFGLHYVVPNTAKAAWGARAILRRFEPIDFLGDRMGSDQGPHSDRLLDLLNERVLLVSPRERQYPHAWSPSGARCTRTGCNVVGNGDDNGPCEQHADYPAVLTEIIDDLVASGWMRPDQAEDFVLHMDDELCVVANTNSSHGYCYVTAWLW